jgi:hypothetical protein
VETKEKSRPEAVAFEVPFKSTVDGRLDDGESMIKNQDQLGF